MNLDRLRQADAALPLHQRRMRFRADIEWSKYAGDSSNRWVARDPISLEYFYFSDLERKLALSLDGNKTLQEILDSLKFASLSAPATMQWMGSLLARFEDACLLVQDQPESGLRMTQRMQRRAKRSWISVLLSPLAIRVPLIDPTRWLDRCEFPAKLLLNRFAIVLSLILAAFVGCMAVTKLLDGTQVLDPLPQLLQGERLFWIAACYVFVKSLHEFGHALACRYFGAECHDVGILLLFFTPCLYCDVSDTWKLSSRWHRAAVAAAGIYVELMLAAMAAAIWLTTQPSALQALAVNVMLLCSVGTVLVNANPLLKYDGYYVLSDLWGVPNPAEQSQEVLQESIASWFSGAHLPTARWDAHPFWLGVYGVAAFIYRHVIAVLILWAIHVMLVPLGLGVLALFLSAITIFGLVFSWWKGLRLMSVRVIYSASLKLSRVLIFLAGLTAAIVLVGFVPLPTSVRSRAVNRYVRMEPLFANQSSQLVYSKHLGKRVRAGERVLQLDAPSQRIELLSLRGEIAQLAVRQEQLKLRSVDDAAAVAELPTIVEALAEKQARANLLQSELNALDVKAPLDGIIVQSDFSLPRHMTEVVDRPRQDSPLDPENLGCALERGTLVGWVASEVDGFQLDAFVSERDAELVRLGAIARCRWDSAPADTREGRVDRISPEQVSTTPVELVGDSQFVSVRNEFGSFSPEHPCYRIRVALQQVPPGVVHGSLATVRIEVSSRTLLESLWRLLKQSFHFLS